MLILRSRTHSCEEEHNKNGKELEQRKMLILPCEAGRSRSIIIVIII